MPQEESIHLIEVWMRKGEIKNEKIGILYIYFYSLNKKVNKKQDTVLTSL